VTEMQSEGRRRTCSGQRWWSSRERRRYSRK